MKQKIKNIYEELKLLRDNEDLKEGEKINVELDILDIQREDNIYLSLEYNKVIDKNRYDKKIILNFEGQNVLIILSENKEYDNGYKANNEQRIKTELKDIKQFSVKKHFGGLDVAINNLNFRLG